MPELSIDEIKQRIAQLNGILEGMKNAKPAIRKPIEDARDAMLAQQEKMMAILNKQQQKLAPKRKKKKKKRKGKQQPIEPKRPKKQPKPNKSKKDYYQAVGEVACNVSKDKEGKVTALINGDKYPVFPQVNHGKMWENFEQQTFPSKLLLKVYPVSFEGRCQALLLWGFADITPENKTTNKFKIRGIYNNARLGKVTIARNHKSRKKMRDMLGDRDQLTNVMRPKTHRINWDNPSVPRWNGEGKPTVYFVDLVCKLTRGGGFKVISEAKPPKTDLPKVLKKGAIAPTP